MENTKIISADRVRQVINYNMDTGAFTWRCFMSPRALSGEPAGSIYNNRRRIRIDGRYYLASRLAVLYVTGSFPRQYVDHIDGNTLNDVWKNLRQASVQQNAANSKPHGELGIKGVHRSGKKFKSLICIDGHVKYLGTYTTISDAAASYEIAARAAFGEFVRMY